MNAGIRFPNGTVLLVGLPLGAYGCCFVSGRLVIMNVAAEDVLFVTARRDDKLQRAVEVYHPAALAWSTGLDQILF